MLGRVTFEHLWSDVKLANLELHLVHSCLHAKLRIVPFFHILANAMPVAIP